MLCAPLRCLRLALLVIIVPPYQARPTHSRISKRNPVSTSHAGPYSVMGLNEAPDIRQDVIKGSLLPQTGTDSHDGALYKQSVYPNLGDNERLSNDRAHTFGEYDDPRYSDSSAARGAVDSSSWMPPTSDSSAHDIHTYLDVKTNALCDHCLFEPRFPHFDVINSPPFPSERWSNDAHSYCYDEDQLDSETYDIMDLGDEHFWDDNSDHIDPLSAIGPSNLVARETATKPTSSSSVYDTHAHLDGEMNPSCEHCPLASFPAVTEAAGIISIPSVPHGEGINNAYGSNGASLSRKEKKIHRPCLRKKRKALTPEERQEIIAFSRDHPNVKAKAMANNWDASEGQVRRILNPPHRPITLHQSIAEDKRNAVIQYEKDNPDASEREIARKVGLSRWHVRKILGIPKAHPPRKLITPEERRAILQYHRDHPRVRPTLVGERLNTHRNNIISVYQKAGVA
ncbi:hypothetical protein FRB94_000361 [Tulasnella sp. JGI-2019a]|nr:hypothetical protein FRB94_000361 [Tulasnella sp. JGI-2019a]